MLQCEVDACVDSAATLAAEQPPWEALTRWVARFAAFVSTKRGLSTALHSGDPAYSDLPRYLMQQLEPALDTLLTAARDSGHVTASVTSRDVLLAVALLCQPVPGENSDYNARIIHIFVHGLRGT